MHLYKAAEWQGATGNWYCNDCQESTKESAAAYWWIPARILGITPADFVKLLVEKYKCDSIFYDIERDVLSFSWKSQAAMRIYKNAINKAARDKKFIC